MTALIIATNRSDTVSVKALLDAKANVKVKDKDGEELGEIGKVCNVWISIWVRPVYTVIVRMLWFECGSAWFLSERPESQKSNCSK